MEYIDLAQVRDRWGGGTCKCGNKISGSYNAENFLNG